MSLVFSRLLMLMPLLLLLLLLEGICTVFRDEFPQGVPCQSDFNIVFLRKIFEDRLDEKEVAECETACPKGTDVSGTFSYQWQRVVCLPFYLDWTLM